MVIKNLKNEMDNVVHSKRVWGTVNFCFVEISREQFWAST